MPIYKSKSKSKPKQVQLSNKNNKPPVAKSPLLPPKINQDNKSPVAKSPLLPPKINQDNSSMMGGLLSTVAQGFAFGTGSSIAHRGVDAVMGNNQITNTDTEQVSQINNKDSDFNACKIIFQQYQQCLESEWNPDACVEYKEQVNKCMELGTK